MKVRWATTYGNTMLIGRLICKVIRSSLVTSRNPARVLSSVGRMMRESCSNDRYGRLQHYKQVDGMYYWHPHIPGYPSPAFDRFLRRRITNSLEPASDCFLYSAYIVITGSYNFSRSAAERNDENTIILYNAEIAALFIEEFERVYSLRR